MNPDYESAEEEKVRDRKEHSEQYSRLRASAFLRKGKEVTSPGKGISISSNKWNGSWKNSNIWESNRIILTEGASSKSASGVGITNDSSWNQGNDVHQTSSTPLANATGLEAGVWNNNQHGLSPGRSSGVRPETPVVSQSTGVSVPSNTSESEKIWHYQDPSGKIQGPFSMMQLQKWSMTGYFPTNLRIWRTSEKQEDSILLTDALIGKFQNDLPQREPVHDSILQSTKTDHMQNNLEGGWRGNSCSLTDRKQNGANWKANRNDAHLSKNGINEMGKAERLVTQLSAWSAPNTEVANPSEGGLGTTSRDWESSKRMNAWPGKMQGWNSSRPVAPFAGSPYQPLSYQSRGSRGGNYGRWNGSQDHRSNCGSNKPMVLRPIGQVCDKLHPHGSSSSQQYSKDMCKSPKNDSSNQWENDSFNLPTTPQSASRGWRSDQGALNKPFPSNASVQPMISGWGTAPSTNEAHQSHQASQGSNKTNMSDSVGGCGSSAVTHKQMVTADGEIPYPAVMASMPNAAEVIETVGSSQLPDKADNYGNSQISSQQKKPPEHESSTILENLSSLELPRRDEDIPPSTDTRLAGGLAKNQYPESDYTSPTPRCGQASSDVPSSECGEVAPSLLKDRQVHPLIWPGECGRGKKWAEAHGSLAGKGSDPGFVDAQDTNLITESDTLEPESAQKLEISSGLNSGSESLGWASHSATKQKPDSSRLTVLAENRTEQNQSGRPEPSLSGPDSLNSHILGVPSDGKSIKHLMMPVPALKMISSGWSGGSGSTIGNSQNVQLLSLDGSKPPSSSQCEANASTEPAQPSNAALVAAANVHNNFWGVAPQNPRTGTGPQGNAKMICATPMQGNMNMGWGLIAQSNMNMAWGTPAQVIANFNMGLGTAPQANMVVNTGLVPPAQGNANANLAWGTPFQGNSNPNSVWGLLVQGSMTANPGWGTSPQSNTNPNPGLGTTPLGHTNQNASWGTTLGNMDANSNPTWGSGQGNMNLTWDPSAGDLNTWNAPQTLAGDGHSFRDGGNSGHAAGRPLWNRMQSDGSWGSSGPPSRGQRGICRFHENGHCKKGASCNYIHS